MIGVNIVKNRKTEGFIQKFIESIKSQYKNKITIGYDYDEGTKEYRIWHNIDDKIDSQFVEFAGLKIAEILFENDIFDFYIAYDEVRANKDKYYNMTPYYKRLGISIDEECNGSYSLNYSFSNNTIIHSNVKEVEFNNEDKTMISTRNLENYRIYSECDRNGQGVAA